MREEPYEIEFDREEDGRWIAEIAAVPGCLVYGATKDEARQKALWLLIEIDGGGN